MAHTPGAQDGVPLTPHIFSALFTACTAGTSPSLADVALEAYHDMHIWWTAHAAAMRAARRPTAEG